MLMDDEAIPEAPAGAVARAIIAKEWRKPTRVTRSLYATPRPSIRDLAAKYKVNKSSLARYLKALREGIPAESYRSGERPRALTYSEESAIIGYAVQLSRGNFPPYRAMLVNAANTLRSRRIPLAGKVSEAWVRRFLKEHPELKVATCRAIDIKRNAFKLILPLLSSGSTTMTLFGRNLRSSLQIFRILTSMGIESGVLVAV